MYANLNFNILDFGSGLKLMCHGLRIVFRVKSNNRVICWNELWFKCINSSSDLLSKQNTNDINLTFKGTAHYWVLFILDGPQVQTHRYG